MNARVLLLLPGAAPPAAVPAKLTAEVVADRADNRGGDAPAVLDRAGAPT